MTKFRCIKGSAAVPVGTIIVGKLEGERICLTKDSTVKDGGNNPYFKKEETIPLIGYVWQWESCEGELDKDELLERFEDAVDVLATYERDILEYGESDIDHSKATEKYESAKAELLKRLS
ncbi:hypothetical protein [Escherichia phage vB_EcoM_PD205]|nr:hypothetical protein [Escherichia phage vB_EcoM_PD205]